MTDQQRPHTPPPIPPTSLPFSSEHALEGVCRRLAPEDVRAGQYVAVFVRHHDAYRVDERTGRIERQRIAVLPEAVVGEFGPSHPGGPAGVPLEVVSVALPFVVARRVQVPAAPSAPAEGDGPPQAPSPVLTLDLRQVSLAEVGQAYARAFEGAHATEPARAEPQTAPAGPDPGATGDVPDGDGGSGEGGGGGPRGRPSRAVRLARRFRVARWRE